MLVPKTLSPDQYTFVLLVVGGAPGAGPSWSRYSKPPTSASRMAASAELSSSLHSLPGRACGSRNSLSERAALRTEEGGPRALGGPGTPCLGGGERRKNTNDPAAPTGDGLPGGDRLAPLCRHRRARTSYTSGRSSAPKMSIPRSPQSCASLGQRSGTKLGELGKS